MTWIVALLGILLVISWGYYLLDRKVWEKATFELLNENNSLKESKKNPDLTVVLPTSYIGTLDNIPGGPLVGCAATFLMCKSQYIIMAPTFEALEDLCGTIGMTVVKDLCKETMVLPTSLMRKIEGEIPLPPNPLPGTFPGKGPGPGVLQ